MAIESQQAGIPSVERSLSLTPVGLKEAALDSPTFRATAVYFGEQLDLVEKWLDSYSKCASKLGNEVSSLEGVLFPFLATTSPPGQVSEAIVDHDYTLAALKRYGDGAKEFWGQVLNIMRHQEDVVVEPIRQFLQNEVRGFKELRRTLDQNQRYFDSIISKYASQSKSKEPSSLREDAFQLHEARKAYLKASMDFCFTAPQVRASLDKLLIKVLSDQWRDMSFDTESAPSALAKVTMDIERIKTWSQEMESGEKVLRRELILARRQIEETAEISSRPSRDLDFYAPTKVSYVNPQTPALGSSQAESKDVRAKLEKQGWLFQRSVTGKPARTVWFRRWFFVKKGIFGCLVQGTRPGGVEESDKISVLLCGIRPAMNEERRFCFEVKTKDTTISLQAETQAELSEWISAFNSAKHEALEDPASTDWLSEGGSHVGNSAFSIKASIGQESSLFHAEESAASPMDDIGGMERVSTLPVLDREGFSSLASRASFDVRKGGFDGESTRDHASRIIQKLDLHRKSTAGSQLTGSAIPSAITAMAAGGIANFVSPSGYIVPSGHSELQLALTPDPRTGSSVSIPPSTLSPSTLVNPPAPTNLSRTAIIVSGERPPTVSHSGGAITIGIMANLWGSNDWSNVERLSRNDSVAQGGPDFPTPSKTLPTESSTTTTSSQAAGRAGPQSIHHDTPPIQRQRASSVDAGSSQDQHPPTTATDYPRSYPLALKAQDAQFHLLFSSVPRSEKVVLVFRASWNPADQYEFPGRVYVTMENVFFYSHYLGLVLTSLVSLDAIDEVTASAGKDNDFLFLHFKDSFKQQSGSQLRIKTFLEPLKLLERRLKFLVRNKAAAAYTEMEDVIKALLKLEHEDTSKSPSVGSWEDVGISTPIDGDGLREDDIKTSLRLDRSLQGSHTTKHLGHVTAKFKLPPQPVIYAPQGMDKVAVARDYDVSAKALFHVLFGDKSALFQIFHYERGFESVVQGPWMQSPRGKLTRVFELRAHYKDSFGRNRSVDTALQHDLEIANDHLCYVISERMIPWHLPKSKRFRLISKYVITHVAKSRCRFAVHIKVQWQQKSQFLTDAIETSALHDLELNALDVMDMLGNEVVKLRGISATNKAIQIFGHVGHESQAIQISSAEIDQSLNKRRLVLRKRTLTSLAVQTALRKISSALQAFMNGVGSVLKLLSANRLLLLLLFGSITVHIFNILTLSSEWLTNRHALSVISSFDYRSTTPAHPAVYLEDISEMWANSTQIIAEDDDLCYSSFRQLMLRDEAEVPFAAADTLIPSKSTKSTAKRLRRSRQNIASYRHDLIVAMRVVNVLDQEILHAEWENWVFEETFHCQQLEDLLSINKTDSSYVGRSGSSRDIPHIQDWQREYCGSCRQQQHLLVSGDSSTGLI